MYVCARVKAGRSPEIPPIWRLKLVSKFSPRVAVPWGLKHMHSAIRPQYTGPRIANHWRATFQSNMPRIYKYISTGRAISTEHIVVLPYKYGPRVVVLSSQRGSLVFKNTALL